MDFDPVVLAEMRAMAREASENDGRGKHDDPAYYSRNLAILLNQALDHIDVCHRKISEDRQTRWDLRARLDAAQGPSS